MAQPFYSATSTGLGDVLSSHRLESDQVPIIYSWTSYSATQDPLEQVRSLRNSVDYTASDTLYCTFVQRPSQPYRDQVRDFFNDSNAKPCTRDDFTPLPDPDQSDQVTRPQADIVSNAGRSRRRTKTDPEQARAQKLKNNRQAAERFRQKHRTYVRNLQDRLHAEEAKRAKLKAQVSELRDAVLLMKERLVLHSWCNDGMIMRYLLEELPQTNVRSKPSFIP